MSGSRTLTHEKSALEQLIHILADSVILSRNNVQPWNNIRGSEAREAGIFERDSFQSRSSKSDPVSELSPLVVSSDPTWT